LILVVNGMALWEFYAIQEKRELQPYKTEGLLASTACIGGIAGYCVLHPDDTDTLAHRDLLPLMDLFGKDRFFLELQFNRQEAQQRINKFLVDLAKDTGFSLIATADSHYPKPGMWQDREIYKLLGYQVKGKGIDMSILDKKEEDLDVDLYLKNGDQLFDFYKKTFRGYEGFADDQLIRDAIERTYSIAHDLVGDVEPDDEIKLPKTFQVTAEIKTPFDQLKKLTLDALKEKGLNNKTYIQRAAYELKIINKLGVVDYFLAKKQILDVLRKHMLLGPGRGSGAGSLVNYLLGITLVDPIRFGLLFERFMSPSRQEMPDIDSDIEMKEESLEILQDYFGAEDVVAVSNYNRLQLKSLVKDIAKLYGVSYDEVNAVTKVMEAEAKPNIMEEIGHDQKLYEFTYEKAKEHSKTFNRFLKKYPDVGAHITNLFKEVRSIGRHAGGVLVVPDAEGHLPIIKSKGVFQSPIVEGLTAHHLHHFGLIKFDVLGLTTLRIIRRCIENILKSEGNSNPTIDDVWKFYNEKMHPDVIDFGDKQVFKNVYKAGKFPSIFQFSEGGVQSFCKKAKPNHMMDISAITALWRPGPLKGMADKRYLAATEKDLKKEHPIVQEILRETKGVLVYQEQFMMLAHKLAGFTLDETNKLRKLLVRPETSLADEMKKERIDIGNKFVNGCMENGMVENRANALWEKEILGFISYGFNKSHSVSYAINSFHCAWLFTHYDEHWIKACLECDPNLEKTINTVRSLGFKVTKPDVNLSEVNEWHIASDCSCVPALTSLKNVGITASDELVRQRKGGFKDLQHFLYNDRGDWRWSKLNKKSLQSLIRIEALESLDCIGEDKLFKNYKHLETALFDNWQDMRKGKKTLEHVATWTDDDDWSVTEKMAIQKEIIGFYDKGLIIAEYSDILDHYQIKAIDETPDKKTKRHVWGVVEKVEERTTKTGKPFLVVNVTGMSNLPYMFRVWDTSKEKNSVWAEGNVVVFSLSFSKQWGYSLTRGADVVRLTK
jgi:DNA polymerase-3 subunit alpha